MIYQETPEQDKSSILRRIAAFADEFGIEKLDFSSTDLEFVCFRMRSGFPCNGGLASASVFKKVAFFVSVFIKQKPIKTRLSEALEGTNGLARMDINAIVALDIAIRVLHRATVHRSDGKIFTIEKRISLSNHSYLDILDALSSSDEAAITPHAHFKLLSVFFEQLVYKDNPTIQYPPESTKPPVYTPVVYPVTAGDACSGV